MWLWSACSIFALTDLKNIPKDVCLSAFLKAGLTWLLGNTQDKKKKKKKVWGKIPTVTSWHPPPRWQNTITLARIYHTDQSTQSLRKVVLRQAKGKWKHERNAHKLSDTKNHHVYTERDWERCMGWLFRKLGKRWVSIRDLTRTGGLIAVSSPWSVPDPVGRLLFSFCKQCQKSLFSILNRFGCSSRIWWGWIVKLLVFIRFPHFLQACLGDRIS